MTTETKSTENSSEVQIKKILVPIDGSEYSLKAAKYAITIAKHENAQLFCIHSYSSHPLWPFSSVPTGDKNHADSKGKVEDLFGRVRQITKNEGLSDVKTHTFVMLNPLANRF